MGAGTSRATPRTRLKPLAPGVPLAPSSMNTVAYFSVDTGSQLGEDHVSQMVSLCLHVPKRTRHEHRASTPRGKHVQSPLTEKTNPTAQGDGLNGGAGEYTGPTLGVP
jgi:hypothetical protein